MEQETPQEWVERFQRDVEEVVQKSPAIVERAVAEFDDWWRGAGPEDLDAEPPPSFQTEEINKELECSRREARLLREEIGRLKGRRAADASPAEDAGWKERAQRLQEENERLRARQTALQGQFVEMRLKLSRAQADYESEIERLTDKAALLEEQIRELKENRQFLQTEHARQCSQLSRLEEELKAARRDSLDAAALSERLKEREAERSALEGALAELRGQAAALQERVLLGGQALGQGLARLQQPDRREAEERLLDTTRFLEDKLRAIQDETKEELGRLRELIDGLARIIQ